MGKIFSVKDNSKEVQDSKSVNSREVDREELTKADDRPMRGKRNTKEGKTLTIDFSPKLMFFILSILAFIYFGKQVLTVILFVFFGFVIMSSVKPIVNWLRKKGFSKGLAITVAYFLLILIILGLIFLVSIPFVNQLAGLVSVLPGWINEALLFLEDFSVAGYSVDLDAISGYVTDFIKGFPTVANVKNIATFVSDFFGVGAFLLTSLVFSIYLLSEHDTFADVLLIKIVSDEKRKRVKKLVMDVENKLGSWVLGQAVVSVTATIFSWIVLTILGVPFALPLAMFAGLINVIPNLGSTLAGFTMSLVALITVGPINALVMLVAYVIYQMVENSLIVPKVMGNAVGLKPIVVMLGVIVFLIFFGLIGGFMAVPLMVIAQIVYEFYIDLQKLEAKGIV
jgi:predicted PurR-regulated permease PerM